MPAARSIFTGPDGVRAGWRLLIFLAIAAVLVAPFVLFAQPRLQRLFGTDFTAVNLILGDAVSLTLLLIAAAITARIERRSLAIYGLPPSRFLGRQFWTGALWGFIMFSSIIGLMALTRVWSPGGLALAPSAALKFASLWAIAFLLSGLVEEFLFRGYLQFTLTTGIGFWPAALITSALFAAVHGTNKGETWVGLTEIVLIALFLCLALRRTGNLWFAIGWHFAFDWAQTFLYSTPNSGLTAPGHLLNASLTGSKWLTGGTAGPEASIFDVIATTAGILLLAKLYPAAQYPAPQSPKHG
jgi:membrane protease YdiL (CAAX protease family)